MGGTGVRDEAYREDEALVPRPDLILGSMASGAIPKSSLDKALENRECPGKEPRAFFSRGRPRPIGSIIVGRARKSTGGAWSVSGFWPENGPELGVRARFRRGIARESLHFREKRGVPSRSPRRRRNRAKHNFVQKSGQDCGIN